MIPQKLIFYCSHFVFLPTVKPMIVSLQSVVLLSAFWYRAAKLKPDIRLPYCPFPPLQWGQSFVVPSFIPPWWMPHTHPCPGSCHLLFDTWPLNSFCKLSLQCQHYLTTHCEDIRMTGIDQSPSFAFLMFQVLNIIHMGKVPLPKPNGQEENYGMWKILPGWQAEILASDY